MFLINQSALDFLQGRYFGISGKFEIYIYQGRFMAYHGFPVTPGRPLSHLSLGTNNCLLKNGHLGPNGILLKHPVRC